MGDKRHTNNAGKEGPINSIAAYWMAKKIDVPQRLAMIK
jgi:hypothetical protein